MSIQHWFRARIRELDQNDCLDLLRNHEVGRIAFTDEVGPVALPVNYALDIADVLVATSAYGAIAKLTPGKQVSFEIDDIDPANESGWSVIVRGWAEVEDLQFPAGPAALPQPWPEGARNYLIRIRAHSITGRQLIPV